MEPGSALLAHPYPALGQRAGPYEEERPGSDMSSYATLKAVGKKDMLQLHHAIGPLHPLLWLMMGTLCGIQSVGLNCIVRIVFVYLAHSWD